MTPTNKSRKLTPQELDIYTKYLALKMMQIIVQSRLGDKICTPCKPGRDRRDWFDLAITDLPDVAVEAKRWLCPETGRVRLPYRIEISLRTAEGEKMALEYWTLSAVNETRTGIVTLVKPIIYNAMGKLLKSLLCVARTIPAYRLARRQCPQSYAIYYRNVPGDWTGPEELGEGHRCIRIGQIPTFTGALQLTVAFRTKMTIVPSQKTLMLDSHHFTAPQQSTVPSSPISKGSKKPVDLNKPLLAGAFVDVSKVKRLTESKLIVPEEPAFCWLLEGIDQEEDELKETLNELQGGSKDREQKNEEFVEEPSENEAWTPNEEGEKMLEELPFPFAISEKCPTAKLANFYKDCHNPPILQTFEVVEPPEIEDIKEQLDLFEKSIQEYDEMITSLCESSNNNVVEE